MCQVVTIRARLNGTRMWGWLDPLIAAPQGDPMLSILPIILVGVLFGLAMDYRVFLVSRIHEMHRKGLAPEDAVIRGFSRSAPVLVAASAIMAVVFAGFAGSPTYAGQGRIRRSGTQGAGAGLTIRCHARR